MKINSEKTTFNVREMNYDEIRNLVDGFEDAGLQVVYGDARSIIVRAEEEEALEALEEYQRQYRDQDFFIDVQVLYADDIAIWYTPHCQRSEIPNAISLINAD